MAMCHDGPLHRLFDQSGAKILAKPLKLVSQYYKDRLPELTCGSYTAAPPGHILDAWNPHVAKSSGSETSFKPGCATRKNSHVRRHQDPEGGGYTS
ncbi:hypothetical protein N7465_000880 [Penicillium sp. CMV-2018d]|nr:hypothetical protein N7465_000880 [Penicillium sp. CMV-2018d]